MFDFSGISTDKKIDKNDLMTSFRKCVINGINKFNDYYGIEYDVNENDKPDNILKDFLTHFNGLYLQEKEEKRKKLYIIIDEYDNFTNAILEGNAKDFIDIVGNNGFVKSFYANIKIFVKDGIVDRFFATGICPITLNSMTTGFNIASDISTDREFNSMIGLTHDEILNLLNEYDSKTKNAIYNVMKANYDGYLFSKDLSDENRVFNATLTMYLLNYYERFHEIPEELTDKNIIVRKMAQIANEIGAENVTLKMLADNLNIQTPSLYNHIKSFEDLQKELMIYGWDQMADVVLNAVAVVSGYDDLEALCYAFYRYAVLNPGIFNAMIWYNRYQNKEMLDSTERIFSIVYKITASLNISKETCNHLIRTFHGFLEGFSL